MTRETKVGIFVAVSFLSLVAVVIAAKLRQVEDPGDAEALARAKLTAPTPLLQTPNPLANPNPGGGPDSPPAPLPPGLTQVGVVSDPFLPAAPTWQTPAVPDVNVHAPVVPTPQAQEPVKPFVPSVPAVAETDQTQKLRELANAANSQTPSLPNFPTPPPVPTVTINAPKPLAPDVPSITLQPKQVEMKIPGIEPPSIALNANPQAPAVPSPVPYDNQKPFEPARSEIKITAPPVGSPASFSSGAPQVVDYPVKPYVLQPGDTSLEAVSRTLYNTDRYARALHQFNRDYPLAKESIKADPPRLQPGQPVFYPPADILQARYASVIPPESNAIRSPISVGNPTPLVTVPGSPNNAAFVPPSSPTSPVPGVTVSDSGRKYRVRETGEHILEVAQQTLGDRRRWSEIYRLNPQIRPDYPIPGGTELRLP